MGLGAWLDWKVTPAQIFSCKNFGKFLRTPFCKTSGNGSCRLWLYMKYSDSLLLIFSYHRAKENAKYFFSGWFSDHDFLVKKDLQWKIFKKKSFFLYNIYDVIKFCIWRAWFLIFPTFWSHSVLIKTDQYVKSSLLKYNLSMFGKIIFVVDVDDDVIGIQAKGRGFLRKMWYDSFSNWNGITSFQILDTVISLSIGLALETWTLRDKTCLWLPWHLKVQKLGNNTIAYLKNLFNIIWNKNIFINRILFRNCNKNLSRTSTIIKL